MAHDINFWALVEYDVARSRLDEARAECLRVFRLSTEDIAAVILRLSEPEGQWRITDETRTDLRGIAAGREYDLGFRLSVIDACVPDETEPVFLEAVRRDCPRSYEYYRLYRYGVLSLV